ncbi:MAG: bifunctional UDP-N-acetylmuramoyl-tripeptide:D-alanyl-D-alanine ligase/alanine racemase [Chitinophagaceae bacterium]|nr:bifunctional UDP-N-acetylmuramoyl-tripeptide:D-alanyl-D-alanine ligase/alanine racemase [Chitinophagaceae bacterium]MCW5906181.1 bifunctional UDP-N-acetylmuramoyl-tripeptide:D-alanyl-D-alanine ligase/alanine racemase [Chitinophagaceae bacterium]
MSYPIKNIATIIQGTGSLLVDADIEYLLTDSRKITFPSASLFFALHSNRRNGHSFIQEVYERGVRNFVIDENIDTSNFIHANFIQVKDTLIALQTLAAHHRNQFHQLPNGNYLPVIGITGSNGKTIVKEWLYQLLHNNYTIVRSPRSYNSQIGVPLSVWQINSQHTLGIFEAGISTIGEMEKLEPIIQPTIGVLTSLGNAHNEGFASLREKAIEKLKLFQYSDVIICQKDSLEKVVQLTGADKHLIKGGFDYFTWSKTDSTAKLFASSIVKNTNQTDIHFTTYYNSSYIITIPFTDDASIDNAITCCCVLHTVDFSEEDIIQRMALLQPVEMRMQLKKAVNNCYVINDSYSNDISSLSIALDYLKQQSGNNSTTVILSDILQSGLAEENLYKQVAKELKQRNIHQLIGIGEQLNKYSALFNKAVQQTVFYNSVEDFFAQVNTHQFKDEFILLKGARRFAFERINDWLEYKVHQTVLEINLSAIVHNLKTYQNHLQKETKVMAMVKAFSYGSGSAEIARLLQFHKVDYLAVAYIDEGIELRKAGISLPIMVMNIDEAGFHALVENNLEPEIYSFNIYQSFHQYLLQQGISKFPVHIKLNTGMNRLGFDAFEVENMATLLQQNNTMVVQSVFSHLTSSEDVTDDVFTLHQANFFLQLCSTIQNILRYNFIKHISNSAAVFRHSSLQMNMIRLGIGLYGVDSSNSQQIQLQPAATLKTTIAQIRNVQKGNTVGYNRKGIVEKDSKIATIRIGYADGFSRKLGNGIGSVFVNGQLVKTIGNICMDMAMIDVTDIPDVKEGDVVEIFGNHLSVQQVAAWCGTISYEIMTSVSQRVKRIYVEE